MESAKPVTHPILARFARYRWDKVRDQHQVVFPEGVLVVNDSSAEILALMDGRSENGIVEALEDKHGAPEIREDVKDFLKILFLKGLLANGNDHSR